VNNCTWLKPKPVAQIEFTEWTLDGHLRHSKFVGLREDKQAREVVLEALDRGTSAGL
jgi:bifunctional non-homologous end joining protein LigD